METNCNFPDDLVTEILSWLPVRQLLRFKCVSKSWSAIVDHPRFIIKHHERQYVILKQQGDTPMVVDTYRRTCSRFLDLSSLEDVGTQSHFLSKRYGDVLLWELKGSSAPEPHRNREQFPPFDCIGYANGIVLLEWDYTYLGLWNPATREFKVVPPMPRSCKGEYSCGMSTLGFDPNSGDIKIITQIYRVSNKTRIYYCYEMFSLKTNSWQRIEHPSHLEHNLSGGRHLNYRGVYINNIYYWTYTTRRHESKFILSFNFCNETFQFLSQPRMEGEYSCCSLSNYNGALAFIYYEEINLPVEIWVMTKVDDHGILSAWQHLFSIGPFREEFVSFCSFRVGGDMLLRLKGYPRPNNGSIYRDDGDVSDDGCLYDPATKKITMKFGLGLIYRFEYVENLLKLTKRI